MDLGSILTYGLPLIVIVGLFYYMNRSEKKKQKQVEQMRNELSVGDTIVTIGGMVGKIVGVTTDNVVFETGEDRVRVEVAKWAISNKSDPNSSASN